MPSMAFASGLLGGYYDSIEKERARKDKNALDMANFLMSTGRVRDYNDLIEHVPQFQELFAGPKGKGGKGGKAGKGGMDPHQLMGTLLNPILQGQGGGQAGPQGADPGATASGVRPQPQQPQKPLLSEAEATSRDEEAMRRKGQIGTETATGAQKATYEEQVRQAADLRKKNPDLTVRESLDAVGLKIPAAAIKWTPGTATGTSLPAGTMDIYGQPIDPSKAYKQGTDAEGKPIFAPAERTSDQPSKEGTPQRFIQDALGQLPKDATYAQRKSTVEQASTDWVKAHQSMTFTEKVELAKQRALVMQSVGAPKLEDVEGMAQTIKLGDTDVQYLDLTDFKGARESNAARQAAIAAGIVPLSTNQATQMNNLKNAQGNLSEYWNALKSKLPADAASRPFKALENVVLGQYLQEDDILAATSAFDQTVIPQLRAIAGAGIGRITNYEMQQVAQGRPKITDTFGTAKRRVDFTNGILERAAHSVLDRNLNKDAPAGATDKSIPDALAQKLKTQGPGLYHDTATRTYWKVDKAGAISSITKQEYEK